MWQVYISDVEKTGETDSIEKPKLMHGTPVGKLAVPKKWTSSSVTHFGREGHMYIYVTRSHEKGLDLIWFDHFWDNGTITKYSNCGFIWYLNQASVVKDENVMDIVVVPHFLAYSLYIGPR